MFKAVVTALVAICVTGVAQGTQAVHHQVTAEVDPAGHTITVTDTIDFNGAVQPDENGVLRFLLHTGLEPKVLSEGWSLQDAQQLDQAVVTGGEVDRESGVPVQHYELVRHEGLGDRVTLTYSGPIFHQLATQGEEYQRAFSETPGLISEQGVFLSGSSFWTPTFGDRMMTFDLTVTGLIPPWDVVSQGRRILHETDDGGRRTSRWLCSHPVEEIYLVAGPWYEFHRRAGEVDLYAFLREKDAGLAGRYLDATARYLKLYDRMLPPFPYGSFALVENFWETGYGMPGFTLLGPRVIRFPWILTSSYPHELLHNWWGNSVYVEKGQGNWCEGLTAYMADHLFAEQRGDADVYRRSALKKYADFVSSGDDFPLSEFHYRRSAATEAVGYGKSMMFFHMMRRMVGDRVFLEALSSFFSENRFQRASFADIAAAFTAADTHDWRPFVDMWTGRVGAPEIVISDVAVEELDTGSFRVLLGLAQIQDGEAFSFRVPVALTLEGQDEALWIEKDFDQRRIRIEIECPLRPLRIDVDPAFDVMRRLDPLEVEPALSTVFGAEQPLFVLPASAQPDEIAAWKALAAQWSKPEEPRMLLDSELESVPEESAWILGRDNRFARSIIDRVAEHGLRLGQHELALDDRSWPVAGHSFVVVGRGKQDPETALAWISADSVAALEGLARKLPHYSRYAYLVFGGDAPDNLAKGMWTAIASPLTRFLPGAERTELHLPGRAPLAELPAVYDREALQETAAWIADDSNGGRGLGSPGLARASDWVEERFREIGLEAAGDQGYRTRVVVETGDPKREMEVVDLVGRVPGTNPDFDSAPVIVMAHLDHLGRGWPDVRSGNEGLIHPGADDNASGVAVLLELAKTFAGEPQRPRPVLFAVVSGEEAGLIGSRRLIESLSARAAPLACINLDTVGRLGDGKLFVINTESAREWSFIFMGVGYTTGAPIEIVKEALDSSDQMACIEAGIPAVQLFTGPHEDYHRPSDTSDKLDADGMAVVAEASHEAIAYLAEREEPLTSALVPDDGEEQQTASHPGGARKASLGTMPDFGFAGPGVRVAAVVEGSAAYAAGIAEGDIVIRVDDTAIEDLRSYARVLRTYEPGDEIDVTVERDGQTMTLRATLREK